jgi:hypothetical protein
MAFFELEVEFNLRVLEILQKLCLLIQHIILAIQLKSFVLFN